MKRKWKGKRGGRRRRYSEANGDDISNRKPRRDNARPMATSNQIKSHARNEVQWKRRQKEEEEGWKEEAH